MSYEVFEYLTKIEERLKNLNHWQKTIFAIFCAETNFPLVEMFGEKILVKFYRNTIDEILKSISLSFTNLENEMDQFLDELDSLPETEEDDSNSKSFKVMSALGVLHHTLVVVKTDSFKDASFVSRISNKNKSGIELFLLYGEKYTRIIRNDEPILLMSFWDKKEVSFQQELLNLIENEKTLNQILIEHLKNKAKNYANEFAIEVQKYAKKVDSIQK